MLVAGNCWNVSFPSLVSREDFNSLTRSQHLAESQKLTREVVDIRHTVCPTQQGQIKPQSDIFGHNVKLRNMQSIASWNYIQFAHQDSFMGCYIFVHYTNPNQAWQCPFQVVEAMEAELKTMEKNVPKIRMILSSVDNSSITLTEHLNNRQVKHYHNYLSISCKHF